MKGMRIFQNKNRTVEEQTNTSKPYFIQKDTCKNVKHDQVEQLMYPFCTGHLRKWYTFSKQAMIYDLWFYGCLLSGV